MLEELVAMDMHVESSSDSFHYGQVLKESLGAELGDDISLRIV